MTTILVVDDEKRIRGIYKNLFQKNGYQVIESSNIAEARECLKTVKISLVLLDINMGEFNGDDLYEVVRCFHRDIKVIVSSVYPIEDQKKLIPEAADYFDKSEGNRILLEKVARALTGSHVA